MWLIGQLYIKLGWWAGIYSNCCLCCSIFLLVASNTFLGVGTQGDMFTQIYLISHLLSCSCSHFFLCPGSAIFNRRKMCICTIKMISIAGADNYCHILCVFLRFSTFEWNLIISARLYFKHYLLHNHMKSTASLQF